MEYSVGLKLRLMRERANLTQSELAKKLGYSSSSSIAKIESGACGLHPYKAMKFAEVLGCKLEDLIDMNETPIGKSLLNQTEDKQFQDNVDDILKFESLQNILGMLSQMDAKQILKVEKVIRTLTED